MRVSSSSSSTLVVLCLCLAAFASGFDLTKLVVKLTTPSNALLQSRSVETRQTAECQSFYQCHAVDQPCDYDPSNFTVCTACYELFGTCSLNENKTLCDCGVEVLDCLRDSGKPSCQSYISSYLSTCEGFCTGNETSRCGDAPTGPLTVNICGTTGNAYCTTEGTCANAVPLGSSCNPAENILAAYSSVCAGGNGGASSDIICDSGECVVAPNSQSTNDGCSIDDECISGNCTDKLCLGVPLHGTCTSTGACEIGLYCAENKTCIPFDGEGASCESGLRNCDVGLICGANGTCIPLFSGAVGDSCKSFEECAAGTTCNYLTKQCGTAYIPNACANDTDCPEGTSCNCNPFGPEFYQCTSIFGLPQVTYTQDCVDRHKSLLACAKANKCSHSSGDLPTSCAVQYCESEMNCALACAIDATKASPESPPANCLHNPTIPCGSSTSGTATETGETQTGEDSAASIFAPVATLLVAIVAFFA